VKIWDARPLTRELQAEQEALGLVEFLFRKGLDKTQVLENLRSNRTISEPVRQKAFAFVEPCWHAIVCQQTVCWVDSLFAKPILKPDAIESARNNHVLSAEVRRKASALAERWRAEANALYEVSWAVVRKPDAGASAYRLALRQIAKAYRLAPDDRNALSTLGVAQYRVGQYSQALQTLAQSDRLWAVQLYGSIPADQAFLAMAHYRLGHREKARLYLNRLRELTKTAWWAVGEEGQAFLREAEGLINGAPARAK
jgi:hypothetical protein